MPHGRGPFDFEMLEIKLHDLKADDLKQVCSLMI